jgi:hypothetical protein
VWVDLGRVMTDAGWIAQQMFTSLMTATTPTGKAWQRCAWQRCARGMRRREMRM